MVTNDVFFRWGRDFYFDVKNDFRCISLCINAGSYQIETKPQCHESASSVCSSVCSYDASQQITPVQHVLTASYCPCTPLGGGKPLKPPLLPPPESYIME